MVANSSEEGLAQHKDLRGATPNTQASLAGAAWKKHYLGMRITADQQLSGLCYIHRDEKNGMHACIFTEKTQTPCKMHIHL